MTPEELKNKKEVILHLMNGPLYRPMRIREIAVFLDVPKSRRADLEEVLNALVEEGKIRVSGRGKYGIPKKHDVIGTYMANSRGYGFVRPEDGQQDIFIGKDAAHGALDGDTVQVSVEPGQRLSHAEGAVIRVLKRANETIVGYYRKDRTGGIVHPDNQRITADIRIPAGKAMGAVNGHKVVVRVTRFPEHREEMIQGEVEEILGHITDPGTDILSIIRAYDLPDAFPKEALQEAEAVSTLPDHEGYEGRRDLRDLLTVTIDGEDAKDLDDAVSIRPLENGRWELGVHIADVSAFVAENSALDREALRRGTSVYLADRVIPMLPRALSNGICSLNEGEDRLALSCIMETDASGAVLHHEICETVIRSNHRMTYTEVNRILTEEAADLAGKYGETIPMLRDMDRIARKFRERRRDRGGIDFDFPETKVTLDEAGRPVSIEPYERNEATMLIEDLMIAANETVAEEYYWLQLPFLYRTHDKPDPEKMRALAVFVNNFGFVIRNRNGEIHPKELQKLLERAAGSKAENLISRLTLRSMKRACYNTECTGHFGLASRFYTHFTSPIRRYPDLQIHRIIKEHLHGTLDEKRISRYTGILPEVAKDASALERRADEAERDSVRYKMCQYMEGHIGEEYPGVISGVTRYGLFVALPNTVEGMVRIQDLPDDYYEFSEQAYELTGQMTGRKYCLGGRVKVRVAEADRLARTVSFLMSGS